MKAKRNSLVVAAIVSTSLVGQVVAATKTFDGGAGTASGKINVGLSTEQTLSFYLWDTSTLNFTGSAFANGDDVNFGLASGNIRIRSTTTSLNPNSLNFTGGATYDFLRASTTAATSTSANPSASNYAGWQSILSTGVVITPTAYNIAGPDDFGSSGMTDSTATNGSITLGTSQGTGFTGKVILRARPSAASGTTAVHTIYSGTLEVHDAAALTSASQNNNSVTLNGGTFAVNIDTGNYTFRVGNISPGTSQLGGALNVIAGGSSSISNNAVDVYGNAREQGNLWNGPIKIGAGATLTVNTGGGTSMGNNVSGGGFAAADNSITGTFKLGSASTTTAGSNRLRLSGNYTSGSANLNFDLGSDKGIFQSNAAAGGTTNLGSLSGNSTTWLLGGTNTATASQSSTIYSIGGNSSSTTFAGTIGNGVTASTVGGSPTGTTPAGARTNMNVAITKTGTGTLSLTGSNVYGGKTTVSAGILKTGNVSALGQGTNVDITGGTLELDGFTPNTGKTYTLSGGSLLNNNTSTAATISSGASASISSNATTGSGAWTGAGNTPTVTITGGGGSGAAATAVMQLAWLRFAAADGGNVGSGYVTEPKISFSAPDLPNGRPIKAVAFLSNNGSTQGQVAGITILDPGYGYTSVPTITIDNTGTNGSGFLPVYSMTAHSIVFSSAGSGYTSAPTVTLGGTGYLAGSGNVLGGNGSVLLAASTNNNIGGAGALNINAAIVGGANGTLTKVGSGTTTLNALANSYSSATAVSQGQLTLANTGSITGTSSVTVDSSATLRNDGTLTSTGAVTVNAGGKVQGTGTFNANTSIAGTLQPGNSVGKLTWATGTLTLASGSTSNFEIAGAEGAANAGITYDNVKVTSGALSYDGTLNIDFASVPTAPATYDLFDLGVAPTGNFASVNLTNAVVGNLGTPVAGVFSAVFGGISYTFTSSTGDLVLAVNAVPEPLTAAGVILLAGRVLGRRSRESI